jgi:hypothetical protein
MWTDHGFEEEIMSIELTISYNINKAKIQREKSGHDWFCKNYSSWRRYTPRVVDEAMEELYRAYYFLEGQCE